MFRVLLFFLHTLRIWYPIFYCWLFLVDTSKQCEQWVRNENSLKSNSWQYFFYFNFRWWERGGIGGKFKLLSIFYFVLWPHSGDFHDLLPRRHPYKKWETSLGQQYTNRTTINILSVLTIPRYTKEKCFCLN